MTMIMNIMMNITMSIIMHHNYHDHHHHRDAAVSFSQLIYLDISCNVLASLPETFSSLTSLEVCNLDQNQIVTSQNRFNGLSALQRLVLHHNRVHDVFADMGCCSRLQLLDLSHNDLATMAPEFGMLNALEELRLDYNALTSIPPELGSCARLQRLSVSHNRIEGMLPETIGLVDSLREIDFSFNGIDELPRSIIGLELVR